MDNKSALALAKNPVFHECSKHIRVKYHFVMSCLDEGSVQANYINTQDQLADFLTKSLGRVPGAARYNWDDSNSPEDATQDLEEE